MFTKQDTDFLCKAIKLARKAKELGEVPVGAVLVYNNEIIAEACNCQISDKDPTAHAEIKALRIGAKKLNNYRLLDTTLYVTLEPCIMCAGAIIHARVKRLVFGAFDDKVGTTSNGFNIFNNNKLNHTVIVSGGLLETECSKLLRRFFQEKR